MLLKWFYVKESIPVVAKGVTERQPLMGRWPTSLCGDTDPALSPQLQEVGAMGSGEKDCAEPLLHSL